MQSLNNPSRSPEALGELMMKHYAERVRLQKFADGSQKPIKADLSPGGPLKDPYRGVDMPTIKQS